MAKQVKDSGPSSSMFSIERSEFERLQTQLIDLRTTNYTLKEENSKLKTETTQLQSTVQTQTRELDKANKTIQRSKKAKELSTLIEENDSLQRKMESQEEDFRLQNRTLMDELSRVIDEKDQTVSELANLRQQSTTKVGGDSPRRGVAGGVATGGGEEVTFLKAENAALQKSLHSLQEKFTEQTDSSNGGLSLDPATSGKVLDLELRLATEEEEKKLLRQQLEELQNSARKQQAELQSELDKWMDKAKKKQDSLVQLQEEKEKHYLESRASFNEMVRSKDHRIHTLQTKLDQANSDLASKREVSVVGEEIAKQLESLSTEKEELSLRCATMIQDKEALVEEQAEMTSLLEELGKEFQQTKAEVGEEKRKTQDLIAELEEAKLSQEQLADQVVKTSEEKHKLQQEMDSVQKVAEKRKTILDEMAIKGQLSATEQRKKLDEMEQEHSDEICKLETMLQKEKSYVLSLSEANEELPALKEKVKALEETKKEVEEKLQGVVDTLESEREVHVTQAEEMKADQEERLKNLIEELNTCQSELAESRERVGELETEVDDKRGEVRIVERKSQALLKDLKYQLKQMQKREERLQEQLNQLRGGMALDYSSTPPSVTKDPSHDSLSRHSRESSLSSLRGLFRGGGEGSGGAEAQTPSSILSVTSPTNSSGLPGGLQFSAQGSVNEETKELLGRVAELQKEKWALEERVGHLENTGSALAEDVIQKSEIIKSYFMETKADHSPAAKRSSMTDRMSPMRLMNWGKGSREETLGEINRKMQRALEEALMKNIHLHKNLEMLTGELEKHHPTATSSLECAEDSTLSSNCETKLPEPLASVDDDEHT